MTQTAFKGTTIEALYEMFKELVEETRKLVQEVEAMRQIIEEQPQHDKIHTFTCALCRKVVSETYKTKRPKRCKECRERLGIQ